MTKRIVLYYPKFPSSRHLDGDKYFPPLSLLCATSKIVEDRVDVEIVDGRLGQKPDLSSSYLGVSVMTGSQILDALDICREFTRIRIWGGWHPTVLPIDTARDPLVDIAVKGQGENTLSDIMSGKQPRMIQGIAYRNGIGDLVATEDRPFLPIYELPRPKWDLVDWENYIIKKDDLRSSWYYASQGCTHHCNYCCIGNCQPVLSKLPSKIVEREMQMFKDIYGVESMYFADNTFLVNTSWGAEIGDIMHRLGMRWSFQTRVPLINVMSDEQLLRLKERGAYHIDLGIESGCDTTLQRMNKGITVKDAYKAVFRLFRLGFSIGAYFIIGTPYETKAEAFETFRFIDNLPDSVQKGVNYFTPYPQTDFYQQAIQEGFVPPSTLEGWGYHTIQSRLPSDPEVCTKYLSYQPRKPSFSIQRLKRIMRHMRRVTGIS